MNDPSGKTAMPQVVGANARPVRKFEAKRISQVEVPAEPERIRTGILGLDECLSETEDSPPGLPVGTSVLLSGVPGGGKSTIALFMAAAARETLILHGEEKAVSIRKRYDRLRLSEAFREGKACDPMLMDLRDSEEALWAVRQAKAQQVVVDSIQTLVHHGSRRHDAQLEAAEELCGQACGSGGSVILVCHMSKDGKSHAGAQGLAHLVDVHIHVGLNAKKSERFLEVRKNRHGRAGFMVPLIIGASSLTVGTPAPITATTARTALELAAERAAELLLEGKELSAYDYDIAGVANPGMWRGGLEMAAKRLARQCGEAGLVSTVEEFKKNTRKHYRLVLAEDEMVADGRVIKAAPKFKGKPVDPAETGEAVEDAFNGMLELD